MPEFFAFSSNIISVNNYGVKGGRVKGKNLHALSALTENRPPPVAETGLNYVSFCVYSRPLAEKMEAIPVLKALTVPREKFAEMRVKVEQDGTRENTLYQRADALLKDAVTNTAAAE